MNLKMTQEAKKLMKNRICPMTKFSIIKLCDFYTCVENNPEWGTHI